MIEGKLIKDMSEVPAQEKGTVRFTLSLACGCLAVADVESAGLFPDDTSVEQDCLVLGQHLYPILAQLVKPHVDNGEGNVVFGDKFTSDPEEPTVEDVRNLFQEVFGLTLPEPNAERLLNEILNFDKDQGDD